MYNSLVQQIMCVEREPKVQAPAPPSDIFWLRLRLQSSKIAWAPALQPCLNLDKTIDAGFHETEHKNNEMYTWKKCLVSILFFKKASLY